MFFGSPEHLAFLRYEVLSPHRRYAILQWSVYVWIRYEEKHFFNFHTLLDWQPQRRHPSTRNHSWGKATCCQLSENSSRLCPSRLNSTCMAASRFWPMVGGWLEAGSGVWEGPVESSLSPSFGLGVRAEGCSRLSNLALSSFTISEGGIWKIYT